MGKRVFSAAAIEKIRAKAYEREARKRTAKALPEFSGQKEAGGDQFSPQARKRLAELHAERVRLGAKVTQFSERAKALKDAADLAVSKRDAIFAENENGGRMNAAGDAALQIVRLTRARESALAELAGVKENRKAAKSRIADAISETDRIIAGENPKGTIFEKSK